MSDERRSSSVAFLTERLHGCVRPGGSLKRKLGQAIPSSRQNPGTYPSPPMSNPPSPSRPSPRQSSSNIAEQQTATIGISLPALSGVRTLGPLPSSEQPHVPASAAQYGAGVPLNFASPTTDVQTSIGSVSAYPSGQDVFSVDTPAAASTFPSTPAQTRTGRKAKAHVASACTNCKRAHLSCDAQRPCTRCVTSGKQDTCFDVPHKKRGRPRLREEGEFKAEQMLPEQAGQVSVPLTPSAAGPSMARPIARTRHQRTESLRSLRSQVSEGSSGSSIPTPGYPPMLQSGWVYQAPRPPSSGMSAPLVPTAFLDLDLNFIRANRPFQQILCNNQDVRGRQLQDLVASADGENFMSLRSRLKGERESREPAYMPPMLQRGEDPIQGVMEDDVERLASGFSDQMYTWTRARSGAQAETFPARVRLAKATAYFVVVTLPSFRPVEMLPPQSTTLSSPGFMIPPPRAPMLPSQPLERRIETQSAPPAPYLPQPSAMPGPQQSFMLSSQMHQSQTRPMMHTQLPSQPYTIQGTQRPLQPLTPRPPTAHSPMQYTPSTPFAASQRPQPAFVPSMQLPPLTASPSNQASIPFPRPSSTAEAQQQPSDDDEESPKKRRRMDISDVLQR